MYELDWTSIKRPEDPGTEDNFLITIGGIDLLHLELVFLRGLGSKVA